MEPSTPIVVELTDDLIDYIQAITIKIAPQVLPKHVDLADVKQHVLLHLVSRPPKFDPTKSANVKTLLFVVVQRQVWKYATSQRAFKATNASGASIPDRAYHDADPDFDQPAFLDYIDCEDTRQMCRLMLEHESNVSEVARRLGVTEGTIRYRLKMLRGKLRASGFDPFAEVK